MRRTPLAWLAAAVLAAGACAPSEGIPPSTTAPETSSTAPPEVAGAASGPNEAVIGIGNLGAPRTLNPFLDGPDTAVLDLIGPAVFATGYDIDPESRDPIPDVLAAIPTLANGGLRLIGGGLMEVTVAVTPGAVWADGAPITGDDLAFTIEMATDPDLPIRSDLRERYERIVAGSVRAERSRVTFRMDVDASVELLFDVIIPRHAVSGSDFTEDWIATMWVAGGPFIPGSYAPGQHLELVRNDNYWKVDASGNRLPLLDRIVFRFFEPGAAADPRMLTAFQGRDLELALLDLPDGIAADYLDLEAEGAEIIRVPGMEWEQLNFQFGPVNRNPESLNRHLDFRRAIARSLDRNALAVERGTFPLDSALRLSRPDLSADPWASYGFAPERVDGLLFAVGEAVERDLFAGDGPRVVVGTASESPATVSLAGQVVTMLGEAGIGGELQLETSALFFGQTLDNGTWDVGVWRLTAAPARAGAIRLVEMFDPEGLPFVGNNFSRWGTPDSTVRDEATVRYIEIVDDLGETVDPNEIDALLLEAETILATQMVLLPLIVHEQTGAAVWADELEGVVVNPAQSALWNVETWRRVAG